MSVRPPRTAASRLADVAASPIRRVLDRATALEAEGRSIIHLELGRPDFDTPGSIKAGAAAALERGEVHYAANRGRIELRRAVAAYLTASRDLAYDPDHELIVTAGVAEGVLNTMLAVLDPGDEVIVPLPAWPHYQACAAIAGARAVGVATRFEVGFRPDPDAIVAAITPRTRLLVLNSPNNPTGAVYPAALLRELAAIARRHDLLVLSDEIYAELTYGRRHHSIAAEARERTIVLDGLSKSRSMTGWRIGFVLAPAPLLESILRVHQYNSVCVSTFGQAGAARAFKPDVIDEAAAMRETLDRRRAVLVDGLRRIPGVEVHDPGGALYAFPRVASLGFGGLQLAERLLDEVGVATIPGEAFGDGGSAHLRLSFATGEANLIEAVSRIRAFVDGR